MVYIPELMKDELTSNRVVTLSVTSLKVIIVLMCCSELSDWNNFRETEMLGIPQLLSHKSMTTINFVIKSSIKTYYTTFCLIKIFSPDLSIRLHVSVVRGRSLYLTLIINKFINITRKMKLYIMFLFLKSFYSDLFPLLIRSVCISWLWFNMD